MKAMLFFCIVLFPHDLFLVVFAKWIPIYIYLCMWFEILLLRDDFSFLNVLHNLDVYGNYTKLLV